MITMDEMETCSLLLLRCCCCCFGSQNDCSAMVRCLRIRTEGNPPIARLSTAGWSLVI